MTIPQFNNAFTQVKLKLLDGLQNQFGYIESFKVINAGRNVDGIMSDVNSGVKLMTLTSLKDLAELNLGVVTNTGKLRENFFVSDFAFI